MWSAVLVALLAVPQQGWARSASDTAAGRLSESEATLQSLNNEEAEFGFRVLESAAGARLLTDGSLASAFGRRLRDVKEGKEDKEGKDDKEGKEGKEDKAEKEAKDDDEDAAELDENDANDSDEMDADDEDEIEHAIVDLSLPAFPGFPKDEASRLGEESLKVAVLYWHDVSLKAHQRDYSKAALGMPLEDAPTQPGPAYTARAITMIHLAIYDTVASIMGGGEPYSEHSAPVPSVPEEDKPLAAVAALGAAAHEMLQVVYPDDVPEFGRAMEMYMEALAPHNTTNVVPFAAAWGAQVAEDIVEMRADDGHDAATPFRVYNPIEFPSGPYEHIPDPTAEDSDMDGAQPFYAPHWGNVRPFGHKSGADLPDFLPEPLTLDYAGNLSEVKELGIKESTVRTEDQTIAGIFWAYDGVMLIGGPVRLYNQLCDILVKEALAEGAPELETGFQLAKFYAVVNVVISDATVACWRDKYKFNFWRPIIGIRNANLDTVGGTADMKLGNWTQLGAPRTNSNKPGINPAFPAYPSGHATVFTSAVTAARNLLNVPKDRVYAMTSDEYNGLNKDELGNVRPKIVRNMTLDGAIYENEASRVYIGVHWRFDCTLGSDLGRAVADDVLSSFPKPMVDE